MAGKAGSKATKRGPVPDDLEEVVREALRTSPGVKGAQLKKHLPPSHQPFSKEALEVARALAERRQIVRLVSGKTESFFEADPSSLIEQTVCGALARGPLPADALKATVAGLGNAYASLFPKWLKQALSRRVVFKHPANRYGATADVSAKLKTVIKALRAALTKTDADGTPRLVVANALLDELGLLPLPVPSPPNGSGRDRFLAALSALVTDNPREALLSVAALRARLELGKEEFDRIALELLRENIISLSHHDHPASLSEAERNDFIRDDQGTYYNGIAPRRGS